jgi:prevent-host-death family protein
MKIASVADVKARFSEFLKASKRGPVVVTRNGKPAVVLLSVDDEDEIERLTLAYSPKFQKLLSLARQQVHEGHGIQHEDFWREVKGKSKNL